MYINPNSNISTNIELLIWFNGKPKEYSFKYILQSMYTSASVDNLKYIISKYIINNNHLKNLFKVEQNKDMIQHLFTKNEVELEDFDVPHLKNNDILFFSYELLSTYKSSNNFFQYDFIRSIKSGGFGKIFLAKEVSNGQEVAIKEISMKTFSNETLYNVSREYMILKDMSHINIIKFHTFFTYNENFYIVMDYARGGELSTYLSEKKYLSESESKSLFHQIYNAVCYIHYKNIIHRDLKPNNILFLNEERTHIIIIDFGISGFSNGNQKDSVKAGTELFLPPEVLSGKSFESDTKLDMWSLGIILYRMVQGQYPFQGKNRKEMINNIFNAKLEFNKKIKISASLKKLLEGLLEKNYRFRIDTGDILFDKWFEDNSNNINTNKKILKMKKVSTNKSMEHDVYDSDYFNKFYGSDRYNKYYEDDTEKKFMQSFSTKIINNYLSQTKSTSVKIKPKKIYIKNNYLDFIRKNSFKILVRKKRLKQLINIEEEKEENDNNSNMKGKETQKFSKSSKQLILPIIKINNTNNNNDKSNIYNMQLKSIFSNYNKKP